MWQPSTHSRMVDATSSGEYKIQTVDLVVMCTLGEREVEARKLAATEHARGSMVDATRRPQNGCGMAVETAKLFLSP